MLWRQQWPTNAKTLLGHNTPYDIITRPKGNYNSFHMIYLVFFQYIVVSCLIFLFITQLYIHYFTLVNTIS